MPFSTCLVLFVSNISLGARQYPHVSLCPMFSISVSVSIFFRRGDLGRMYVRSLNVEAHLHLGSLRAFFWRRIPTGHFFPAFTQMHLPVFAHRSLRFVVDKPGRWYRMHYGAVFGALRQCGLAFCFFIGGADLHLALLRDLVGSGTYGPLFPLLRLMHLPGC